MSHAARVGVISDTHGLLRPEALAFLSGSDLIIHCGDICDAGVIGRLSQIAPVSAVRGNNDTGIWAAKLPETNLVPVGATHAYVIHDLARLDIDPEAAGVTIVLSGHSHKPTIERRGPVLFMNPGSAGPRRFKLPISVGELIVKGNSVLPRILELDIA